MADAITPSQIAHRSDLPILPSDWRWVQFSETCDRVSVGYVGPTTEFFTDAPEGICFLRSQNVRPGKLDFEDAISITPEFHKKIKKSQLSAGDILIVRVGANRGDCCVVPTGMGELNCANIVFARPKHATGFHAYFFQSELGRNLLLSASVGAAQGVINTGSVATMPVPFPPLAIQKRIAGILSAYDELIENSQRRVNILESMARALYREWFVYFRFPGNETVSRISTSDVDVPHGWEFSKLGDICELRKDQYREVDHSALPLLDLSRMPSRSLAPSDTGTPDELSTSRILFTKGDTLFGAIRCYLHKVVAVHYPGVTNTSVLVLRPKADCFRTLLSIVLSDIDTIRWAEKQSTGTKMPVINWNVFQGMPIAIPSKALAMSFEEIAGPMLDEIGVLATKIENLRRTRNQLLPRLLSGQINVEAFPV